MEHPWQPLMHFVERVDSTMNAARARAAAGAPHGTSIIARAQTRARGRRGRTWSSPAGYGLTLTTILRPEGKDGLHTLSLAAAVAVRRAALALGARDVGLKWPNDLWVGERKLAGILLEADCLESMAPVVLVGIGLNIACADASELPEALRHTAIGLCDAGVAAPVTAEGREALRVAAAHHTVAALCDMTAMWSTRGLLPILEAWASADVLAGHPVRAELEGAWVEGTACGLNGQGELRIRTPTGEQCVQSGLVERVRPQKNGPPVALRAYAREDIP